MALTDVLTRNWRSGAETIEGTVSSTSDQGGRADIALINGAVTEDLEILTAGLKSIYMLSTVAVTIVAKDAAAATVQTIALGANKPWDWSSQDPPGPAPNPFSDDVQTMDCTAAAAGTLQIRWVQDSTP